MMFNPETLDKLRDLTDFVQFERLCCDVLATGYGGYAGIVPQGVGRIDGGKDATLIRRDASDFTVVLQRIVFHFSLEKDWPGKLRKDLATVRDRGIAADLVVFVTNSAVTPGARDKAMEAIKQEFGLESVIYNQEWLRVALDGEFQGIRKRYLSIDYDARVFRELGSILQDAQRHPSQDDLMSGAYYRSDTLHTAIHNHLDAHRLCLVIGRPGHGKTAIAKAIGWELLNSNPNHAVFYISAKVVSSCERWLHHITIVDHDWATFVVDDCHLCPEQVRALLDASSEVRKARLLFVSREIDSTIAGTPEEDFQQVLKNVRVEVNHDAQTVGRIVRSILNRSGLAQRDPGPLDGVLDRCSGDLHIVEFLVRAWLERASAGLLVDVPEEAILDAVYARYVAPVERNRSQIVAVAALSQFEIPVESHWLDCASIGAAVQSNGFVERYVDDVEDVPVEYLRYFHSTPAGCVVRAAFRKGILNAPSLDEYLLRTLAQYVRSRPANLFDVFFQLFLNGRTDLEYTLLSDPAILDSMAVAISAAPSTPSDAWIEGFSRLMRALSNSDRCPPKHCSRLLAAYKERFDQTARLVLLGHAGLRAISSYINYLGAIDQTLATELIASLDLRALGERSRAVRPAILANFSRTIRRAKSMLSQLDQFWNGLDIPQLGARAHTWSIPGVVSFIQSAARDRVHPAEIAAFVAALDLKALAAQVDLGCDLSTLIKFGSQLRSATQPPRARLFWNAVDYCGMAKRAHDLSAMGLQVWFECARDFGVAEAHMKTFCDGLDWERLGEQSRGTPFQAVAYFLQSTLTAGADSLHISRFCRQLDFKILGQASKGFTLLAVVLFLDAARRAGAGVERIKEFAETHFAGPSVELGHPRVVWLRKFMQQPESRTSAIVTDWSALGSECGVTIDRTSTLLHDLDLLNRSSGLGRNEAKAFVEGMGWPRVRALTSRASPDVLAALFSLLIRKCGYRDAELTAQQIFFDEDIWMNAFVSRGCSNANDWMEAAQAKYLTLALNRLGVGHGFSFRRQMARRTLDLKNWNVLLHNVRRADPALVPNELEPILRNMAPEGLAKLLKTADLRNLSLFAGRFAPPDAVFAWRPRLPDPLPARDFGRDVVNGDLKPIAHCLFSLRHLDYSHWCTTLANSVDAERATVVQKLKAADAATVDFFLWNLLTARDTLAAPDLLDHPTFAEIACSVPVRSRQDREHLLAICGTLSLWKWSRISAIAQRVDRDEALRMCVSDPRLRPVRLIRLVAGYQALGPSNPTADDRDAVLDGLNAFTSTLNVPSQRLATEQVRQWVEGWSYALDVGVKP